MKILSRAVFLTAILCLISPCFTFAGEKININAAPLEDLMKIVHIGEARATELISLRPFSSLDDLLKIKGIGEKRLEDIKKQGLAWVEAPTEKNAPLPSSPSPSSEQEQNIIVKEPLKENIVPQKTAAIKEQLPADKSFPSAVLLTALLLAAFSGGVILILKKTIN